MGQSASWLSAPLAKELLEELRQFSLQVGTGHVAMSGREPLQSEAPGSFWDSSPVSARALLRHGGFRSDAPCVHGEAFGGQ